VGASVCPADIQTGIMATLLDIKNLEVRYRVAGGREHCAVDDVSFPVAAGETVGLMGESGCGKSSVALAILGLLEPRRVGVSGSVVYRAENLVGMPERGLQKIRGAAISIIYQEPGISLSPVMRVGAQIAEVVHAHKQWTWAKCREEAHSMLARVGLEPTNRIFAAYPHQLSGGQLQRVVLAQALVCGPALVIADEPTASLDARSQADFIALLRDLKQRTRMSLLLISHTPEIQASLADRLIVMRDGRIVEAGDFDRVYANPADAYTATLLKRHQPAVASDFAEPKHLATGQVFG
jgi:ABC-type glutathione transport system ATPase component